MNKLKLALGLYLLDDYLTRQNNYEEMTERLRGHIDRWERNIEKIENAKLRVRNNINLNREKLEKAENFLNKLESDKTTNWLDKQKWASIHHHSEKIRRSAQETIDKHNEKLNSVVEQILKLESWIQEGENKLHSMNSSIYDLEQKISSARSRI